MRNAMGIKSAALIAAALAAGALLGAAPAQAEIPADKFTRDAHRAGFSNPSDIALAGDGLMACVDYDSGWLASQVVDRISFRLHMAGDDAARFTEIAVHDLCPEYSS
jgi:hypothetical protein